MASRTGFTLIEMLMAAAILAVVLLATQSTIILAARSMPNGTSAPSATLGAARVADTLAGDLAYATGMLVMSAKQVRFTVPDRTGDGVPETIDYSWSGTAGAPLLRQINSGTAVALLDKAQEFALTYDKRTVVAQQTYTESAEVLLCYYNPLVSLSDYSVQSSNWIAQCFRPASLPANTVSWRPTRVQFKAKTAGLNVGSTFISIRPANNGGTQPSNIVLAQVTMAENILSLSYQWIEWSSLTNTYMALPPSSSAALVFKWGSDTISCALQYQSLASTSTDSSMATTTNAGSSWNAPAAQDLCFYAYGKYTTPDPVAYVYQLTSVRCAVRSGSDSTTRVATSIRVLNEPYVSGP